MNIYETPKEGMKVGEIHIIAAQVTREPRSNLFEEIIGNTKNYGVISLEMDYTALEERVLAQLPEEMNNE